jgi:SAM-dependent methyltransferase
LGVCGMSRYSKHYNRYSSKEFINLKIMFFDKLPKKGKILDIGCSIGHFISLDPGRVEGIEVDNSAIEIGRSKGYNIKKVNLDKEKIPYPKDYFSGIYCSHVIEHLDSPLNLMEECYRVLKPGGKIILRTPNYPKYKKFWADYTHKRPIIKETLKRLSEDVGFSKYRIYSPLPLGVLLRKGVISIEKLNNLYNYLNVFGIEGWQLILEGEK